MPALPEVWSITEAGTPPVSLNGGSVDDVEALVRGVIREAKKGYDLSADDVEQTTAQLFERVVVLMAAYDPRRGGILFRPWLYRELKRDAIDYWRQWFGRAGQKRVFDERLLSADRGDATWQIDPVDAVEDDRDSGRRRLGEADEGVTSDDVADRISSLEWLLDEGSRRADRALRGLGLNPGGAASRRDRIAPPEVAAITVERIAA